MSFVDLVILSLKASAWLSSEMLNPAAAFGASGYYTAVTKKTKLKFSSKQTRYALEDLSVPKNLMSFKDLMP